MSRRETSEDIDREAARWAARIDRVPLDPDARQTLDLWLEGDIRRVGALARAQAALARLDIAVGFGPVPTPAEPEGISRRRLIAGSTAAMALAAAGTWFFWPAGAESFATRKGEVRLIPLSDGSTMTLNTASRVEVAFDDARRMVRLIEGEALFEVAKDPRRPFAVESGAATVEAIGTSFTVRGDAAGHVIVQVQEGVVEMTSTCAVFDPVKLGANMRAETGGTLTRVRTGMIDPMAALDALAWREGKIAFRGETLLEAARELARYSDTRIVFESPPVARQTISGYFSITDVPGFARAAADSLGLTVRRRGKDFVLASS